MVMLQHSVSKLVSLVHLVCTPAVFKHPKIQFDKDTQDTLEFKESY